MDTNRRSPVPMDNLDDFYDGWETGGYGLRRHVFSPQAPPPAAPPPPPPKFGDDSNNDDEEDRSYVQEKDYPETSLPPETPQRDYRHNQHQHHKFQKTNPPQHLFALSAQKENSLAQLGDVNSRESQPVTAYSHGYVAVKNMPPNQHLKPAGTDQGPGTSPPPAYQRNNRDPAILLDPKDASSSLSSNTGKRKSVRFSQPTLRRNEQNVPGADGSILQPNPYLGAYTPYQGAYCQNSQAFTIQYEGETTAEAEGETTPAWQHRVSASSGNSLLSPNVGLTNSYEYALWGMAPHELLRFLQRADSLASFACLVIASLSCLGKLLFLKWDQLVLLAYLAAFSFVLLFVEIMAMVTPEQQRLVPNNFMGRIRDQLGFLFHPLGKALFVLLLTTMCWGMENILLSLIGTVYFVASIGWFYAACAYQEDLPRLMGSIDETYLAEARRRRVRQLNFSISSWSAFMENPVVAARESWTNIMQEARTVYEEQQQQYLSGDEEEINFANEQSFLLHNQQQ